jgi:seryl-tRNA synthetase
MKMLDIKFLRENPDVVKENIKKKFQDQKLPLVDEVIELDKELRDYRAKGDNLRAERNSTSTQIGGLMKEKKIDEANQMKQRVNDINKELEEVEVKEAELAEEIPES